MEELKRKVGLRVAEKIILEIASHFSNNTCLILQNVAYRVIRAGFNL